MLLELFFWGIDFRRRGFCPEGSRTGDLFFEVSFLNRFFEYWVPEGIVFRILRTLCYGSKSLCI